MNIVAVIVVVYTVLPILCATDTAFNEYCCCYCCSVYRATDTLCYRYSVLPILRSMNIVAVIVVVSTVLPILCATDTAFNEYCCCYCCSVYRATDTLCYRYSVLPILRSMNIVAVIVVVST